MKYISDLFSLIAHISSTPKLDVEIIYKAIYITQNTLISRGKGEKNWMIHKFSSLQPEIHGKLEIHSKIEEGAEASDIRKPSGEIYPTDIANFLKKVGMLWSKIGEKGLNLTLELINELIKILPENMEDIRVPHFPQNTIGSCFIELVRDLEKALEIPRMCLQDENIGIEWKEELVKPLNQIQTLCGMLLQESKIGHSNIPTTVTEKWQNSQLVYIYICTYRLRTIIRYNSNVSSLLDLDISHFQNCLKLFLYERLAECHNSLINYFEYGDKLVMEEIDNMADHERKLMERIRASTYFESLYLYIILQIILNINNHQIIPGGMKYIELCIHHLEQNYNKNLSPLPLCLFSTPGYIKFSSEGCIERLLLLSQRGLKDIIRDGNKVGKKKLLRNIEIGVRLFYILTALSINPGNEIYYEHALSFLLKVQFKQYENRILAKIILQYLDILQL